MIIIDIEIKIIVQVRERINSEHRQAQLLQRSVDCAEQLMNIYSDTDGYVQHIQWLSSIGVTGRSDFKCASDVQEISSQLSENV